MSGPHRRRRVVATVGTPASDAAAEAGDLHPRRPRGHRRQGRDADRRGRAGRDLHPPVLLPPAHEVGRGVPDVPGRGERSPGGLPAAQLLRRGPGRIARWSPTSDKVKKAQDGVLEFLLINHPLDCPVCDKGGECPLQDQTLAYGPGETRFVEEKRHFEKPIPISELVLLDRERCIQCSRCTRFADEVAGEAQIDFIGRGEQLEVNTFPELPFTSYFSGNTVQICPVGALTAAPYRFAARPWDLDQVESTCTTCSVGCRVAVQSSSNRVTRLLGHRRRPGQPRLAVRQGPVRLRGGEQRGPADRAAGPQGRRRWCRCPGTRRSHAVAEGCTRSVAPGGPESVGVIGGARLTNEGAYAWAKLAKGVLGTDSVDAQLGDGLPAEVVLGLPRATIDEAAAADTVVVLSGDLREELPVLFLRLRSAVVDGDLDLVELSPSADLPDPVRRRLPPLPPGRGRRRWSGPWSTRPRTRSGGRRRRRPGPGPPSWPGPGTWWWSSGRPSLAEDGALVAEAARRLAAGPARRPLPARPAPGQRARRPGHGPGPRACCPAGSPSTRAGPGSPGPGARCPGSGAATPPASWPRRPTSPPTGPGSAPWSCWAPTRSADFPDAGLARRALDGAEFVVAVASAPGPVTERADVVLPAAEAHERPGTTTNIEGRVTRLGQKLVPPGPGLAGLDDRRRAGRPPRRRPRPRLGRRRLGRDRAAGPGLPGHHPGRPRRPRRRRRRGGPAGGQRRSPSAAGPPPPPSTPSPSPGSSRWSARGPRPGPAWPSRPTRRHRRRPPGDRRRRTTAGPRPGRPPCPARSTSTCPTWCPTTATRCGWWPPGVLYDQGAAVARRPGPGRPGRRRPAAGQPPDLDELGVAPGGSVRVRTATASTVLTVVADDVAAPQGGGGRLQRPARRGDRGRPDRRLGPGGRAADGDPVSGLLAILHPAPRPRATRSTATGWTGWSSSSSLIKVLVVFGALMVSVMLMIWFERKVISDMQSRIGPNRAGPFGMPRPWPTGSSCSSRRT